METINLYKPPNSRTLAEVFEQQIRLGIQGYPKTGKTHSALTFPNPVVIDIDRGMGSHVGRSDVIQIPFFEVEFCRKIDPQYHPSKLKDVLVKWLDTEGRKLTSSQTLVLDGNTGLQNAYHRWYETNKQLFLTKSGAVNEFAEWTVKRTYFGEIMELLKTLNCNIVYICHEVDQKDKNSPQGPSYSGKVRPLLTGSFGDELGSHFTDWFRQHATDKPNYNTWTDADTVKWGMNKVEHEKWTKTFPRNTMYYWQTESDSIFDGASSSLKGHPRFVPADYSTFTKYRKIKPAV